MNVMQSQNSKSSIVKAFIALAMLFALLLSTSCTTKRSEIEKLQKHRIAVIHSWDESGEENNLFKEKMQEEFFEAGINAEIHHYYLNILHNPIKPLVNNGVWMKYYGDSIRLLKPDVILVNDDPALECIINYHIDDSLFTNTPVVFAGVSALHKDSLHHFPLMTGFEDRIDYARNLEMFRKITGEAYITVELDSNNFDNRLRKEFYQVLQDTTRYFNNGDFRIKEFNEHYFATHYPGIIAVNFISCASPTINRAKDAPKEDGLKITKEIHSATKNNWQLQVKYDIHSNTIIDRTRHPQFTCIREQFNTERVRFLGGYFASTETQVEDQVEYAVRILRGEHPKSLSILSHHADYYLDWDAMHMMDMPYAKYENQYVIIGAPYSIKHPIQLMLITIGSVFLFGIISFFFARYISRWRKKSNKTMNDNLEWEEKVTKLIFSNTQDSYWYMKDGKITFDQHFIDHYQLPKNEFHISEIKHAIHPNSNAAFETFLNFRKQNEKKTIRIQYSVDNGKNWHWCEVTYTVTEDLVRKNELYGLLLNIDEKKKIEDELKMGQELASQVALKENFLANISHDLRTPLGAVTGFSNLITNPEMTFEEGEREQYGEIIHQNTNMILKMIDSVVEKAALESGDLEITPKPESIASIISDCYNTNRIIAPTNLTFNVTHDSPDCQINIDYTRTKQVINNFLSNAFKFTADGSITLGWKYIAGTKLVEIFVEDTGIGIPADKQEKIFERYSKIDEQDKGTGLGLNISKTIIEKQGGKIGVQSTFGKGSKFYVQLTKIVQCLLMLFTLGISALYTSSCTKNKDIAVKANVVIIHGYDSDYEPYKDFDQEIINTLRSNGVAANVRQLYLNLDDPTFDAVKEIKDFKLQNEHSQWKPDLILTEGDRSAHAILDAMDAGIKENALYIFGSLHHPEWERLRARTNVVPIYDPIEYNKNIALATELTGKNCIEIELDYFMQDSLIREELKEALKRPPYIDNTDFHLADVTDEKIRTIWKDSIIVFTLSTANPEYNNYVPFDNLEDAYANLTNIYQYSYLYPQISVKRDMYSNNIVDKTGRPQFTAVKADFGNGSGRYLAGYFADYATVAHDLGRFGARLMRGADPRDLAGLTHEKHYFMDYQAMEALGMEYSQYKNRFTIVNAPLEHYVPVVYYGSYTLIVIIVVGVIITFIVTLQFNKDKDAQNLYEDVKRRSELRKMALNNADTKTIRDEATITDIISNIHQDHSQIIPEIIHSLDINGNYRFTIYAKIDEQSNEYHWWELRFVVLHDKHNTKNVAGIIINIDKAKKYEEELRAAMMLAEEAKQKEDFLMTISHEIRTPLNAVVGFSDVVVSIPNENFSKEELAEFNKIIKTNNNALTAMIEDILMFSRIESGRIQYMMNDFEASTIVSELNEEWRDLIPDSIEFKSLIFRKNAIVHNDKVRIKYIINQFMSNAVKFCKSGRILLYCQYHLNDDLIEYSVIDSGIGMTHEKQKAAFNLFWKDDEFTPGLGLGLSVAQQLADGMGIRITVDSKPGHGSKFSVIAKARLE